MTNAIEQTAETLRRQYLVNKREAVRRAARHYADSPSRRIGTLKSLGIAPSNDNVRILKRMLRAQVWGKSSGSWIYSEPKHIAILSALYGEMLWLDDQPRREAIRKQTFNRAVGSFVNRNPLAAS